MKGNHTLMITNAYITLMVLFHYRALDGARLPARHSRISNRVFELDPASNAWRAITHMPTPIKKAACAVLPNGHDVLISGGKDEKGRVRNEMLIFYGKTHTFKVLDIKMDIPRYGHEMITVSADGKPNYKWRKEVNFGCYPKCDCMSQSCNIPITAHGREASRVRSTSKLRGGTDRSHPNYKE